MRKLISFIISSLIIHLALAQSGNVPKDAKIEGTIISMRNHTPLNNELIVFKSAKNNNEFQAVSNESGKFNTRLPAGDQYQIFIMGFADSTTSNVLNIPALSGNAYYKEAFTVNLEFDPAKTFVLDNVEFDFGKANLRPESTPTLDNLVDYLQRRSTEKIEIGGHTDNKGSDAKNLQLSLERAKTIVAYLVAKGIDPSRLTAKGYGAMEPIEDNNTEAGRQKNRRTEVKIIN
ncbi:MAG: hypothetical protein NVS3B19_09120 [Ginsengibacter sp.]